MNVRKVRIEKETSIEKFKSLLEKYRDYKIFLRDIKLTAILGKRVQFDVDDLLPHLVILNNLSDGWSKEIRAVKMKFIINTDLVVDDLEISYVGILGDNDLIKPRYLSDSGNICGFIIELGDNEKE